MKRVFLSLTPILFLFFITACTHDVEPLSAKAVKGEWQWAYSNGGLADDTLAPINNTLITLSLNSDSTYAFYLNNEMEASGNYSIQKMDGKSVLHLDHDVQINVLTMHTEERIFVWDDNRLWLYDESISDGFNHHFTKVE